MNPSPDAAELVARAACDELVELGLIAAVEQFVARAATDSRFDRLAFLDSVIQDPS